MVIVYSKNGCPQCKMTMKVMDTKHIEYKNINVSEFPEYIEQLHEMGISSLPAVMTPVDNWTGFKPDMINKLAMMGN